MSDGERRLKAVEIILWEKERKIEHNDWGRKKDRVQWVINKERKCTMIEEERKIKCNEWVKKEKVKKRRTEMCD